MNARTSVEVVAKEAELQGHLRCANAAKGLARRAEKAWHLERVRELGSALGWRMVAVEAERKEAA